jgi:hypothetical protein
MTGVIYGREGMGKTSLSLQFPGPVHCMSIGETGYQDLEVIGQVPANSLNYIITDYKQLVGAVSKVTKGTVVIDSTKGLQTKIFDYVLATHYQNNVANFHSYSSGSRKESPQVLQAFLDMCNQKANEGVNILLLGHTGTVSMPNTMGPDYLCHIINLDDGDKGLGMRSVLTAWAGFIFFLNLSVDITRVTEQAKGGLAMEGKARDEDNRVIYTTVTTAHQAKNRWGMPPVIPMGRSPQEAWKNLYKHFPEAYRKVIPAPAS